MRVLIAIDSFKGSCSAPEAAQAVSRGVRSVFPRAETVLLPVADGGEGTVDALVTIFRGEKRAVTVHDPLGRPITAEYGVLDAETAVVETAAASGLPLLKAEERDAVGATTYGTGELIRHALEHGAKKIVLGLGGSATTDGGMGLAQALGVSFQDGAGRELGRGGGELARLARIETAGLMPEARACRFTLACDVKNKLCGEQGAAAVFGPQKGATPRQVRTLDDALAHYAGVLKSQLDCAAAETEGAGAAGGITCSMLAFFHTRLRSGIDLVLDLAGFDALVKTADLVITGEGRIDAQSAFGKVPAGVAARTKAVRDVPVLAIGGALGDGAEALYGCGVAGVMSAVSRITTLEAAMAGAAPALEESTSRMMRVLKAGMSMGTTA